MPSPMLRGLAMKDPAAAARRSIPDAELRARTLADPERMAGTENDIGQSRLPFAYPTRADCGADAGDPRYARWKPYRCAMPRRSPAGSPSGGLLLLEGGHTCPFTHRHQIRARVVPFLEEHLSARS